jgi:hypothetical protein
MVDATAAVKLRAQATEKHDAKSKSNNLWLYFWEQADIDSAIT